MENTIQISNLSKRYGNFLALDNISIDFPKGKIIGLLGPNGCGKTTTIKLITNLLSHYEGSILINGFKPGVETKSMISYLPDRNFLNDSWTCKQAINFYKEFFEDFDIEKATKLINQLKINPIMKFKEMSKGTKEKLQLILILSRKAKIYLFDEPIAGVDPAARDLIFRLITENYNPEATVIISTHLIYDVEKILDYAAFMNHGKIVMFGEVKLIVANTGKSLEELFKEMFRC